MNRDELIDLTKAKLEEISPFDEPDSFIADDDDAESTTKPIVSYIDEMLDDASRYCLDVLPLTLLKKDIETYSEQTVEVDETGVGRLSSITNGNTTVLASINQYVRPVRFSVEAWAHSVRAFITSSDPLYLVQQDEDVRGKTEKPCVASVPEDACFELFSFPESYWDSTYDGDVTVSLIRTNKLAEAVASDIAHFIAIRCAELVYNIFNDVNHAGVCQKEFAEKLNSVLR